MGFWNWQYTASDIADWFDDEDQKYWRQHDEWLMQTQLRGETSAVFALATWYSDRLTTLPQRASSMLTSGVIDALRLGNDLEFSSGLGLAKGIFLNLTRIATLAGPISGALAGSSRYAGLLATSRLAKITGGPCGPCSFVSVNNVLSYLRGRSVQLFGTVDDIVRVAGQNKGIGRETLLASEQVRTALAKYGVVWERLYGMSTLDDVMRVARMTDRPIVFSIQWQNGVDTSRHALTAVKDAMGSVRILDYVAPGVDGFRGFGSLAEMGLARPQWGTGFSRATLRLEQPVVAFDTQMLKLLEFSNGIYRWGLPLAMGVKWLRGASPEDKLFAIGQSAWRYLKSSLGDDAPTPPTPSVPPTPPVSAPQIPSAPDAAAKKLGVSPLAPEAAGAPRSDWLTGVQYRMKYLAYYKGAVHGNNDQATKDAVLAFQKAWFTNPKEWDSIPGPITQAMLYSAVGW